MAHSCVNIVSSGFLLPQSCQKGMINQVVKALSGRAQASHAQGPGASLGTTGRTDKSGGAMMIRAVEVH